jgi:hypothetical protein
MRNAKEAAKIFRDKNVNKVGKCLWEVQEAYQSGHMFYDARAQWQGANHKHPGDRTPPIGAPVCFSGGAHDHIAIYVGAGRVRSTDVGGPGRMGTASISWFATHWGYGYHGWIGDLAEKNITFDDKITVYVKKLRPGVDNSLSVRMLRRALIRRGFLKPPKPLDADHPGDRYTPAVERAIKAWQKRKKHAQTGTLSNAQANEFFAPNKNVRVVEK